MLFKYTLFTKYTCFTHNLDSLRYFTNNSYKRSHKLSSFRKYRHLTRYQLTHRLLDQLNETWPWNNNEILRAFASIGRKSSLRILDALERTGSPSHEAGKEASSRQLRLLALSSCIPFIGFGFVDNFVMIVAGDYFDTRLCVALGFSTMAAAALGNLISDLMGIGLGGYIEKVSYSLGLPLPNMSKEQVESGKARIWYHGGCALGIAIGCLLGMFPLLFIDIRVTERLKTQIDIQQDKVFDIAMYQLKDYNFAEKIIVYLVSDKIISDTILPFDNDIHYNNETSTPKTTKTLKQFTTKIHSSQKRLQLSIDHGIPGHVYVARQIVSWRASNENPNSEDYSSEIRVPTLSKAEVDIIEIEPREILGIPIFSLTGKIIGVIEAINPLNNKCFSETDKQFLLAIAARLALELEGRIDQLTKVPKVEDPSSSNL